MHKILRTFHDTILLHFWLIILTLVCSTVHTGIKKKRGVGDYAHVFPCNLKLCHQLTH